jgi:hypothetical protein
VLDTELQHRLTRLGVPPGRARALTAKIRDELHPVAHVAAIQLPRMTSRGLSGNTKQAVSYASTGAAIGSAVPIIGTAVGAVIGLIAGFAIKKGQKAERRAAAAQLLNGIRSLPATYAGRLLPYGALGSPSGYLMLFQALYLGKNWMGEQGSKLYDHPTSMDNQSLHFIEDGRRLLLAMLSTPPGAPATMNFSGVAGQGNVGPPYTFTNPGFPIDAPTFTQQIYLPALEESYRRGPWAGATMGDFNDPDAQKVFTLLSDKLLSDIVPPQMSTQLATNAPLTMVPTQLAQAGTQLAGQLANTGQQPTLVTPTAPNAQPIPYGTAPGYYATPTSLDPTQAATAGILQTQLSQQGVPMWSQPAQQLAADVASQGVQRTARGPAPATAGLAGIPTPLLVGAGVLVALSFAFARPARRGK